MSDSKMLVAGKGFDATDPAQVAMLLKLTAELPAPVIGGGWAKPKPR